MKFQILFILTLFTNCLLAQENRNAVPISYINQGEQNIPVYDYKGIEPIFSQDNDSTYLINFWATWCIPCVQELPHFETLLKKHQSQKLSVKLVSLDFIDKVDKSLFPFLKKKKLKSEVLLLADDNANEWIDKVDSNWSGALPATVIYNKNGRRFFEKSFTFEELEKEYLKLQK